MAFRVGFGMLRLRIVIPLAILAVVSCWMLRSWLAEPPLFCNEPYRSDHMLVSVWEPMPPLEDELANYVIADYRRNILVMFAMGKSGIPRLSFWHPIKETEEGIYFQPKHIPAKPFFVPRARDSMFIFQPDGTSRQLPLGPDEAEQLHKSARQIHDNLYTFIMDSYHRTHPEKIEKRTEQSSVEEKDSSRGRSGSRKIGVRLSILTLSGDPSR